MAGVSASSSRTGHERIADAFACGDDRLAGPCCDQCNAERVIPSRRLRERDAKREGSNGGALQMIDLNDIEEDSFFAIQAADLRWLHRFVGAIGRRKLAAQSSGDLETTRGRTGKCRVFLSGCIVRQELVKHLNAVFAIECRRWERNLEAQTILPLALASLVFGCGGQLSSDEAGLLDAVAFVTGGQEEGAIPQGFETRWRRTVHERKIEYQAIGPNAGFGQADDPHRDSRHVRIGVTITSPTKCVYKTVVTTEYSRGAGESFGEATSEVATLDFNKVLRVDIEDGDPPNVVIEGSAWMCKQGGCQDIVKIGISAPRQEKARAIESKRHAIDFIKKACPGPFLVERK